MTASNGLKNGNGAYHLPSQSHLLAGEAYATARAEMVRAERGLGFLGSSQTTKLEQTAALLVENIKRWEETHVHEIHKDGSGFEAAHKYLHGVEIIRSSTLLDIAKQAPKGALLHCHLQAMLPPRESLLIDARSQDNTYVRTDAPLTSKGFFEHALPLFELLSEPSAPTAFSNVFLPSYIPGSMMKYSLFLQQFPGGPQRAEDWVASKIVLSARDAYHARQTVNGIWDCFLRSFFVLRGLVNYETAYRNHFRRVIWHLARDGLSYAELRIAMHENNVAQTDDGKSTLTHRQMFQTLVDVLQEELP